MEYQIGWTVMLMVVSALGVGIAIGLWMSRGRENQIEKNMEEWEREGQMYPKKRTLDELRQTKEFGYRAPRDKKWYGPNDRMRDIVKGEER